MKKLLCGLLAVASVNAFAANTMEVIGTVLTAKFGANFDGYEYKNSTANCSKPVNGNDNEVDKSFDKFYGQSGPICDASSYGSGSNYVCIATVQVKGNGKKKTITKVISVKRVKGTDPSSKCNGY